MADSTAGAEKANLEKPQGEGARVKIERRLARLSLAALGVVFGDISTSPIYAIRECFQRIFLGARAGFGHESGNN